MRLVFYCWSTNRKTYGVNLDAPHHIHPGVISTKAAEAVATFRQPKGPGPMISPRQFAPDITRQATGASHYHQSAAKHEHGGITHTALMRPGRAANHGPFTIKLSCRQFVEVFLVCRRLCDVVLVLARPTIQQPSTLDSNMFGL